MQEHLYPELRKHCMHHGHELRVHDLHWGFKDAISDDHRVPGIMLKVISEVQESMHGLNFVVSLVDFMSLIALISTLHSRKAFCFIQDRTKVIMQVFTTTEQA